MVIGLRHPLQHLRGNAIRAFRSQGLQVEVLGEDLNSKLIEVNVNHTIIIFLFLF